MMPLQLSPRELQALQLLADGHSVKGAAQQMRLSVETVKDHAARTRLKLSARSNVQAAVIAVRRGLL